MAEKKRAARGAGSIRQRSDGRWEARFVIGVDPGTGKDIRKSLYAATQKEARKRMTEALAALDRGAYREPSRMTTGQWLDEWLSTYCTDLKPGTISSYREKINGRIKPGIGGIQLAALTNIQIQKFYNALQKPSKGRRALSPKTIQNIHGILHKALDQAVAAAVLLSNPADHVKLPKVKKADLKPLMDDDIRRFLEAIKGDPFERFFILALFSGLRQSELIGLQWDDVDLERGILTVHRQIQKAHDQSGYIFLDETKNGKQRLAAIAPSIVSVLKDQRRQQLEWQLAAGPCWNNPHSLVFTDPLGEHLKHRTVNNHFKAIVASLGLEDTRFHDLRHSYAINALQAGDSIKAVQEQLGHYSSAFTLDTYAAVSDTMRKGSQDKMEALIKAVSDL